MKISPMSSAGLTVGAISAGDAAPPVPTLRSLKMMTNATPGRVEEPAPTPDTLATPEATEETQPLSPQFAALAKQRRALQVKEREIADREKALAERSAIPADSVDMARLKSDPLGVLLDAGVTYDQMTEAILAKQDGSSEQIRALEAKLKAMEEGFDKKLTDKDTQAEQAALAEMRKEALVLSGQGEEFELVRETGSIPDVMKLIEQTYRQTGEVLDVREALKLVEDELITESLKIARLQKVQGQIAPAQPAPQPQQLQRQMRTLTNRDTASVPMDRKARALAAFAGTLKK